LVPAPHSEARKLEGAGIPGMKPNPMHKHPID